MVRDPTKHVFGLVNVNKLRKCLQIWLKLFLGLEDRFWWSKVKAIAQKIIRIL